jgi:two-component system cell cycle response regulator DivK
MSKKVLYIEDNKHNVRFMEKALGAQGYAVSSAPDGSTGLELAQTLQPDLILLDIGLPDMSGYAVAQQLKSSDASSHSTPIIAITGNVRLGDGEKALAAGCDVYVTKPVNLRELSARVQSMLSLD